MQCWLQLLEVGWRDVEEKPCGGKQWCPTLCFVKCMHQPPSHGVLEPGMKWTQAPFHATTYSISDGGLLPVCCLFLVSQQPNEEAYQKAVRNRWWQQASFFLPLMLFNNSLMSWSLMQHLTGRRSRLWIVAAGPPQSPGEQPNESWLLDDSGEKQILPASRVSQA